MDWLVEVEIECPTCGEPSLVAVDTTQGDYVTMDDCSVCCRPMQVDIRCAPGRVYSVETSAA